MLSFDVAKLEAPISKTLTVDFGSGEAENTVGVAWEHRLTWALVCGFEIALDLGLGVWTPLVLRTEFVDDFTDIGVNYLRL